MTRIRVLLADDNEEIRAALRAFLSTQEDMRVCGEAANGAEALRLLDETAVDVLLLDMIMPQLDGYGAPASSPSPRSPGRISFCAPCAWAWIITW